MIYAGVAQLVEQLICNQQVAGSSPITSSKDGYILSLSLGEFLIGQRGLPVNLLLIASVVRIHPLPPNKNRNFDTKLRFCLFARKACKQQDFYKKKSFRVMDGLLKSEHFQPSHTHSVHSETFPRKITHRFRLFLGRKRCIVFGEFS